MKWSRSIGAPLTGIVVPLVVWETVVRVFDIRRFVLLAPSAIVAPGAGAGFRRIRNGKRPRGGRTVGNIRGEEAIPIALWQ